MNTRQSSSAEKKKASPKREIESAPPKLGKRAQKAPKDLEQPKPKKQACESADSSQKRRKSGLSSTSKITPVGQRGKKRCPSCQQLVPIHCSRCPECKMYEFKINHKPKKLKELCLGKLIYSNPQMDKNVVTLSANKYYGWSLNLEDVNYLD